MVTNAMPSKTQVIIIGAGPTGLSMAAELLRHKIDFIILERNEGITPLSKAIVIQARTLEIFHELGLAEKAIQEGRLTTAMNIFYKGKKRATLNITGLGQGLSPFPFALSLEQSKTEKLLADHLSENGKTVFWKSEFIRFEQDQGVKVYFKGADGREQMIEADYLVGCDGSASPVRHQMGASFEGDTIPKLFYVADVTINSPVINKDELFVFLIKKGFVLFFPMEGKGHYRMIGIWPDKTEEEHKLTIEDIENEVKAQIIAGIEFKETRWFSTYNVHSRKADSFMKGRAFIAGDAAHIHTPAGGQGMNTGIQDAYNLAWKIAYTIRNKTNISVLESYNEERMENAKNLLQTTDRMFDFITGTGRLLNFMRLKIFPLVAGFISKTSFLNKRFFLLLSQIGIAYPHSTLTIKSSIAKIEAGDRMPFFVFKDGKNIFDFLTKPVFKILFFGSESSSKFDQLGHSDLEIARLSFREIPKPIFRDFTNFYILLRPDNHISYIGKDLETCKSLFGKISYK